MAEFQADGGGPPLDDSETGQAIRAYAGRWADPAEFARYLKQLEQEAQEQSPRPQGRVPQTTLWWVEAPTCVGARNLRLSSA